MSGPCTTSCRQFSYCSVRVVLGVHDAAGRFLGDVRDTLLEALPLACRADLQAKAKLNIDKNIVVGDFKAPLVHGAGQPEGSVRREDYSQLFHVIINYELSSDSSEKFLAVKSSKFELRVATSPGIRFEFERDYTSAPCAHIHYSGVAGLLSPALMQNFQDKSGNPRKKGRLDELHLPVGGKRFRPSLEDFLYFVISECGFRGRPGWEPALQERRRVWLSKQASAATRDHPEAAAEALRDLGFTVTPPEGFTTPKADAQW
ncbi:hypothetical protein SAMN04488531_0971 [Corynebacterium coyleae]|nr:hypothetical protein CCOY_11910 [Corynebacterium coyleae]SEB53403.1 hypothetical protein SAMN04488531_0971 [Corynebacterium coyleae]